VALIQVDYEVLDPVTDVHEALKPGAPAVHEGGNLLSRSATSRGDLEAAMAASAFVAQGVFETQRIEHGYMEPEVAVATPTGEGVHLFSQGQGIYDDR